MQNEAKMIINRLIILAVFVALILGGVIMWPKISPSFAPDPSDLPKKFREPTSAFLKTTLKSAFFPDTLIFTLQEKEPNQKGDVYIANWNRDGQFLSFLVGLTSNNTAINYQRVWIMPEVQPIDEDAANTKLNEIFSDSFLKETGPAVCKSGTPTECGAMKTNTSGDLVGNTVRSPVAIPPPPGVPPMEFTIVSACFVPKAGTSHYTSSLCM